MCVSCRPVRELQFCAEREACQEGPQAAQDAEEGALAAAVGPHDHDAAPRRHLEAKLTHQGCAVRRIQGQPASTCDASGMALADNMMLMCLIHLEHGWSLRLAGCH